MAVGFSPQRSTRRYIDATLAALSEQQRLLRLRVQNDHAANIAELRRECNAVLRQIHQRCRELAFQALEAKISHIEELHDSVRMYSAVRELFPQPPGQVTVHDSTGKYILHRPTANNLIRSYFKRQLTDPTHAPIIPSSEARPLSPPITGDELPRAFRRLSNGRASGPDDIPAELLKYGADQIAEPLAALINDSFALGQPLELGEGTLLCLPKPNKPQGECFSLQPIVLLNSIRKAVSLVVLNRIRSDVDNFLPLRQSGFRAHRSTADAIWAHKWLTARASDRRETIYVLGIDLSRAFDSINRSKLITVLQAFLQDKTTKFDSSDSS